LAAAERAFRKRHGDVEDALIETRPSLCPHCGLSGRSCRLRLVRVLPIHIDGSRHKSQQDPESDEDRAESLNPSNGTATSEEVENDRDDCQDEQNVNQPAGDMEGYPAKQPGNQKDKKQN